MIITMFFYEELMWRKGKQLIFIVKQKNQKVIEVKASKQVYNLLTGLVRIQFDNLSHLAESFTFEFSYDQYENEYWLWDV